MSEEGKLKARLRREIAAACGVRGLVTAFPPGDWSPCAAGLRRAGAASAAQAGQVPPPGSADESAHSRRCATGGGSSVSAKMSED